MGHRRLAIIDTTDAGLQPMADPTGRFHLIYNGELYNYLELREELKARGEIFQTETDSEVLLRAYAVWGEASLSRLRGMFAFVIWDKTRKRLFAARDRFGIKPLYLLANAHGVAFASEIKQFLGLPGLSGRMNLARVCDFLASGIADHTAETLFDGVLQLRGGECAVVDAGDTGPVEVRVRRWYAFIDPTKHLALSEDEAAERFRELLTEAVGIHLRSDVPVGSCLSGGLDSSSLVCLMADKLGTRNGGAPVNTISACYVDKSVDEKSFVDIVAAHTGARADYVFPRAEDVFARASDITWHQDEPFGSTSILAQWCVFEQAKRAGIKVMLDGQGADEQLAGYMFCLPVYVAQLIRQGRWAMAVHTLRECRKYHGLSYGNQFQRTSLQLLPKGMAARARRLREIFGRHDWLGLRASRSRCDAGSAITAAIDAEGVQDYSDIAAMCVVMTQSSNLQALLHWEDRNSMAHSIEARVPFLDHPLVEYSLALGNDHKIVGGITKQLLRRAMTNILPAAVRDRRDKLSFSTPEQAWLRGPLKGAIGDAVDATLRQFPGLLNAKGTRRLADEMLNGTRPVDFTLWRIVNLGIWGKRFGIGNA